MSILQITVRQFKEKIASSIVSFDSFHITVVHFLVNSKVVSRSFLPVLICTEDYSRIQLGNGMLNGVVLSLSKLQ